MIATAKPQLDNVCFQMSNICIVLPNNSTSVILGEHLVSELNHVTFFVPEDGPHELAAFTCYEEVKICSAGLNSRFTKIRNVFKEKNLYNFLSMNSFIVYFIIEKNNEQFVSKDQL